MSNQPPAAFDSASPSLDAVYELDAGPYGSGELRVISFEGHEELNGLFSFDVIFWTKDLDESQMEAALLGAPASLGMHLPGGAVRWLRGIASSLTLEGKHEGARHAFRMTLVPRLWLLGKRVNSRIFQDKTVQEIVDAVLGEWNVAHDWNLLAKYPLRQYCVQYQESDLHFVARLLAEEGIFWSFDHPEGDAGAVTERLVLADSARTYAPISGDPGLLFRQQLGDGAMKAEENHVLDFRLRARIEPTRVVLRDYDFRRPLLDLTSTAPDPGAAPDASAAPAASSAGQAPPLEIYDHHGEYEETDADTGNAGVHLEQLRAGAREAEGKSVCRRLLPGHRFDLADHDIDRLNAGWVVTHVHHHGIALELAKKGSRVYENRFRCAPAEVPYRPARPPRATNQVIESAVVVGPEGQEIFTDSFGRIKVQFHWDREGKRNEYSSCWMRVMQAWAGTGWGFQFIPRIGMEVVVSFLGGDLDRPVVMGCLGNAVNPGPYVTPTLAGRSGITTRTTPGGGGYNEIAFDDRAGLEQIFVHAQRDYEEQVGKDCLLKVDNDRREQIARDSASIVGRQRIDETLGDHGITVRGTRTAKIEHDDARHVHGSASDVIDRDADARIGGSRRIEVAGAQLVRVQGSAQEITCGERLTVVEGEDIRVVSSNATHTIYGSASLNVTKGLSLAVGTKEKPQSAAASIAGDLSLKASGATEIVVEGEIRIRSGKSKITIGPNGVEIEADKIKLSAESIEGASSTSTLNMGDKVEIQGKTVKISSEDKAILELDKDAKLDATGSVKIKPGLAAEAAERQKREEQAKTLEKQSIRLFDRKGKPIQNAPYELSFFGWLDKGVAADGTVEVPKFPDVERCHLRWGRPKDQRENAKDAEEYEFDMEVFLQHDHADKDEALRQKLHNLGHVGEDLWCAVDAFQAALGAERTALSDDVSGEVESRYDACQPVEPKPKRT